MSFLFLTILFWPSLCGVHPFADANLTINLVSSGDIPPNGATGDTCTKIIARSNQIYHISSQKIYQSWTKGNLSTSNSNTSVTSTGTYYDWDVSQDQLKVVALIKANLASLQAQWWVSSPSQSPYFALAFSQTELLNIPNNKYVKINGNSIYTLLVDGTSQVKHTSDTSQTTINSTLAHQFFAITPDNTIMFTWYKNGSLITIINMQDFSPRPSYVLNNSVSSSSVTKKITFSRDSSLAIIQTDTVNPLVVYNLTSSSQVHTIPMTETIYSAHFVNSSNQLIIVFGQTNTTVINLTSNAIYGIPNIEPNAVDYTTDTANNIFTCKGNTVKQTSVELILLATAQNNGVNGSQSNSGQTGASSQFFYPLTHNNAEATTYEIINRTLSLTTNTTSVITSLASSMPLSIYFLGFLNYFTMCSLYVLLNFKIPEHIFTYLALIYEQINSDILSLFGISVNAPAFSEERVNSPRGIHFGVSTDITSSNSMAFLFLVGNISFIMGLNWLCSFLKKSNPFRKVVSRQKWNMIFGHVINIIMPLTLPWTFVMLQNGVRNFGTKINAATYLILYFLGLVFPIYYFFQLLQERENKLIQERDSKQAKKKPQQRKNFQMNYKIDMWKLRDGDNADSHIGLNSNANSIQEHNENERNKSKRKKKNQSNSNSNSKGKSNSKNAVSPITQKKIQNKQNAENKAKSIFLSPSNLKKNNLTTNADNKSKITKEKIEYEKPERRFKQFKVELILGDQQKQKQQQENNKQKIHKPITFSSLITIDILQQWYLCQANFLLPCLVLLSTPIIFLVVVQLYTLLGVLIGFKKKQMRINSTILATYPFLFHVCFMIFYWSPSVQVIVITELFCLGIYLLGVLHHFMTLVFETVSVLIKLYRLWRKKNMVAPDNKASKSSKSSKKKQQSKKKQTKKDTSVRKDKSKKTKVGQTNKESINGSLDTSRNQSKSLQKGQKKIKKTFQFDESNNLKVKFQYV